MKQSNHLIAQLNYWADCIEMLGPDDQPIAGLFEQHKRLRGKPKPRLKGCCNFGLYPSPF